MYLYNANSLYGDGQRVLRSQYEKKIPQTEVAKKDRIMYAFMDEMAKAMPQEQAVADRAKPAKERTNLYTVAKNCYVTAITQVLQENQQNKNSQTPQQSAKTAEQETSRSR